MDLSVPFITIGGRLLAVAITTTVVFAVAGPILTQLALGKAGEAD